MTPDRLTEPKHFSSMRTTGSVSAAEYQGGCQWHEPVSQLEA
jgi:hypothetical protein